MLYRWSYLELLSTQHRETERRHLRETESKIWLTAKTRLKAYQAQHSTRGTMCETLTHGWKDKLPHWPNIARSSTASRKCSTDGRTWSCCRHKSSKRRRCSIGRPRARSSRLASTIHGRGLVGGDSGSSSSACETIGNTPPPHIPATPSNKSGTHFLHSFSEACDICKRTKFTTDPCRKKLESGKDRTPQATAFIGIQQQRITKFSMKRTDRDCIIDVRERHKIWPLNGYRVIRAEPRLHNIR